MTGKKISCALGTVASGSNATVTVSYTVPAGTTGDQTNTATVSSSTTDPETNNNTASDTDTVTPSANRTRAGHVTGIQTSALAISTHTYTITVHNGGPSNASGVSISD